MDRPRANSFDRAVMNGIERVRHQMAPPYIPLAARPIRDLADGRGDLLVEVAGLQIGHWLANLRTETGSALVTAGLMIWAGADPDQLSRWVEFGARRRAPGAA